MHEKVPIATVEKAASHAHEHDDQDDGGEAYSAIYLGEPTEQELLDLYRTYRAATGEPFEPYERQLIAERAASETSRNGTEGFAVLDKDGSWLPPAAHSHTKL